jgi:hypothetical protein
VQCGIGALTRPQGFGNRSDHEVAIPRTARRGKVPMMKLDDVQKLGKDNMDATLKSFGAVSKSVQAIAVEMADYSKKSFEHSTAAIEKLFTAKTIEKAIEVQSDFVRSSYEGFVAEATKLSELYADLAKESYKPFESYLTKASSPGK